MINCVTSRYNKNVDWVYKLNNINKFYIYDKENPENESYGIANYLSLTL